MIQLGGISLPHLSLNLTAAFKGGTDAAKYSEAILARKTEKYFMNKGINELNKKFTASEGSGITLAHNELKNIMKVIKSIENREIFFKEATENVINQKGSFLGLLMRVGLLLMKIVLTPIPKSVLIEFGLTALASATDAAIQKKIYGSGMTTLII